MGQIGQTSLAVVPTMKGMRKLVTAEAKASVKSAGRVIESDFGKSGVQAGRSLSSGFKAGSQSGVAAIKQLTQANATATQAWSRDNRTHQDALGKVRVAQAKLNDTVKKYGEESSQSIGAQERLASAQRKVQETGARVATSYSAMKSAQSALKTAQDATTASAEQQGSRMGRVWQSVRSGASAAASGIGRAFGPVWEGIKTGAAAAGRFIGDSLKVGAAVAGVAVTGLLAKMIGGGWSRLSSIENAKAKMTGLGFSAEDVKAAMDGASEAVDGTAYSLDEMASLASTAMAAGLKPGEELNNYMATLKNASAAANVPLSEMGSIMGKVVTGQKAYTAEINQIADRGLPIWSKLQEEYGVTADEMRDMVSRGEVDAETFFRVMDNMTGSVAEAMGNTTQAKIKNFGSALSKLGADVLAGIYPIVGPLFDALKSGVQMIQAVVAPAFAGLGDSVSPLSEKLTAFSDRWAEIRQQIKDGGDPLQLIKDEWPKFGGVLEKVQDAIKRLPELIDGMASTFGTMGSALGPVIEQLGPLLGEALRTLMDALAPILPELGETLLNAITELAPPLVDLLAALVPLIGPLTDLLVAVLPVAAALVDVLVPAIQWLIEQIAPVFDTIDMLVGYFKGDMGVNDLAAKLTDVGGIFGDMFANAIRMGVDFGTAIGSVIQWMVGAGMNIANVWTSIVNWVQAALTNIGNFFSTVWTNILNVVTNIMTGISNTISSIINGIRNTWTSVWNGIRSFVSGVVGGIRDAISNTLNSARNIVSNVLSGIRNTWTSVWNGILSFFWGIVSGIQSAIGNIAGAVSGIANTVWNSLGNVGSWLVNSGRALIQGFIDGIRGMMGNVGDAVGGIVEWARGFFPNSPAKRGPLSGSGWTRLKQSGDAYMQQWIDGVQEGANGFDPELPFDPFDPGSGGGSGRRGGGPGGGFGGSVGSGSGAAGPGVTINGNVYGNPREIVDEIEQKQRRASALYGVGGIR